MAGVNRNEINFNLGKKRLSIAWFILSAIIFLIFVGWTLSGKFEDKSSEAWNWLLPTIMPTLSLMIGILVADSSQESNSEKKVSLFVYRLAVYFSLFYLFLILIILIFHGNFQYGLGDIFKKTNLFLAPLQGLVSAAIGAFYYKRQ